MTKPDFSELRPGLSGTASLVVTEQHTARHVGSGSLDVLATPVMIALMEAAAVKCLEGRLSEAATSLGVHVEASHERATPAGERVTATAVIQTLDERMVWFWVEAADEAGPIGRGRHRRAVVDVGRFLGKLARNAVASQAHPGPREL